MRFTMFLVTPDGEVLFTINGVGAWLPPPRRGDRVKHRNFSGVVDVVEWDFSEAPPEIRVRVYLRPE